VPITLKQDDIMRELCLQLKNKIQDNDMNNDNQLQHVL